VSFKPGPDRRRHMLMGMDTARFQHAIALRDAGRAEEALQELSALGRSAIDPQERATLILNEATCLTILGRFDKARERQREAIRISPTVEIRASADFGDAGIAALEGKDAEALDRFDRLLRDYDSILASVVRLTLLYIW
jgi:tetratricopeptide (TPR) repeat protein